jgi:hypothetical protein
MSDAKVARVCLCCGAQFEVWRCWLKRGPCNYCSRSCARMRRPRTKASCSRCGTEMSNRYTDSGTVAPLCQPCRSRPAAERLWERVDKNGPIARPGLTPCWLWTGSTATDGYGSIGDGGRVARTHVLSWTIANGPVTDGLFVLHKCDVRRCLRPSHLFLGTHADNMRDMNEKGRLVRAPGGVDHNRSKLNPDQVREIRRLHATGAYGYKPLARMFGVYDRAIVMIVKRLSWKHVA